MNIGLPKLKKIKVLGSIAARSRSKNNNYKPNLDDASVTSYNNKISNDFDLYRYQCNKRYYTMEGYTRDHAIYSDPAKARKDSERRFIIRHLFKRSLYKDIKMNMSKLTERCEYNRTLDNDFIFRLKK